MGITANQDQSMQDSDSRQSGGESDPIRNTALLASCDGGAHLVPRPDRIRYAPYSTRTRLAYPSISSRQIVARIGSPSAPSVLVSASHELAVFGCLDSPFISTQCCFGLLVSVFCGLEGLFGLFSTATVTSDSMLAGRVWLESARVRSRASVLLSSRPRSDADADAALSTSPTLSIHSRAGNTVRSASGVYVAKHKHFCLSNGDGTPYGRLQS